MHLSATVPDDAVPDLGDRQWVDRIRDGDVQAFETVFRTLAPALCVFVRRLVYSPDVAEDLVQDLFLTLWRQRRTLTVHASLTTYLYTAARNRALNHIKHERVVARWRNAPRPPAEHEQPTLEDALHEAELTLLVQAAIARLPERTRLVFTMSRQQGMTYGQIAKALGVSVKTVETQMGRALRSMRTSLRGRVGVR